jgi:hypothetical protein
MGRAHACIYNGGRLRSDRRFCGSADLLYIRQYDHVQQRTVGLIDTATPRPTVTVPVRIETETRPSTVTALHRIATGIQPHSVTAQAYQYGNTTTFSNGRSCTRFGNIVNCY